MNARPLALLTLAVFLACGPAPLPPAPVPDLPPRRAAFSAERAHAHLAALTGIGPRVAGTEGAEKARAYIVEQLSRLGVEVTEQVLQVGIRSTGEELRLVNVGGRIPGTSEDAIVLAAPYDSRRFEEMRFVGANDGASGAALLLELARAIAAHPLPYTTWVVFLDGEAPRDGAADSDRMHRNLGSQGLATALLEDGTFDRIRLLVYLNRVADPDLRIARDIHSNRIYRAEFWTAAARLGHADAFPEAAGFESTLAGHEVFVERGLRRALAIVDTSFGGDEPPGVYANTEDDDLEHVSAESLRVVANVTLEALEAISQRFAKIDRFADTRGERESFSFPGQDEEPAGGGVERPEEPGALDAGASGEAVPGSPAPSSR
jgi:hypothetical protein